MSARPRFPRIVRPAAWLTPWRAFGGFRASYNATTRGWPANGQSSPRPRPRHSAIWVTSRCYWRANNAFVRRKYEVRFARGAKHAPVRGKGLKFFFPERVRLTRSRSDLRPCLGEDRAEDLLDLVEVLLRADQRRGELDHRVTAVVGAADEAGVEQRVRQEAAQQPLRLVVVEGLLGVLVLDELDAVEVPGAADVADDRQVGQLVQGRAEAVLVGPHVAEQIVALEDVQVGQRHRRRHRVPGERD